MTANDLIKVAKTELGYHEKASNKNLDSKTANSGSNNYNKYARDLANAGYFGGSLQGQAWCAIFVSAMFYYACNKDKKKAMAMQCFTGNGSAGCGYVYRYYLAENRVYDTPKVGDQFIVYNIKDKTYDHTGLVYTVGKSSFTTIEGNKDNEVKSVTRSFNPSGYKYYFCRPKYDDETKPMKEETKVTKETTVKIELNQLSLGSKGAQVKTLQRLLKSYGYKDMTNKPLEIDGDFGNKTKFAVLDFQVAKKLIADGVVGAKTWEKLLK